MRADYGLTERRPASVWRLCFALGTLSAFAMIAMGYATQQMAALLGYPAWLGSPVHDRWYWPWSILIWAQHVTLVDGSEPIITKAQAIFVMPQVLLFGLVWFLTMRQPCATRDVHGTASWADRKDLGAAGLLEGQGVYVGGFSEKKDRVTYLRHNGPEHVLVFAPTRSGKGVGLVLPTLLSWPHSALILDIKGENWALTSGWRCSQGHRVLKFDPTAVSGSCKFNPLAEIRLETTSAISDAQNVASMLVDPDGQGLKDYWNKASFSFLSGAILHCMVHTLAATTRIATLSDLSFMLADPDKEIGEVLDEMLQTDHAALLARHFPHEDDDGAWGQLHDFIAASAREMKNKAPNELSGVISTAVANLALYRDPVVARNTSACDFRIADLMNHESPVSLYLVLRPSDIDRLRPLIRLVANIVLRRLTERMEFADGRSCESFKHRLLLMMDEFTALGRLEIFERALAFMAGYGIKAFLIVQDLTQLQQAYGKEESVMSNCHIRVAFAPNKIETAEVLSKMTGKTTVVQNKTSISGHRGGHLSKASVSISEVARPLLTPDECMRLPGPRKAPGGDIVAAGDMLIFPAGFRPVYGRQILYFLDSTFLARARIPAPQASDSLTAGTPSQGGDYADFLL